MNAKSTWWWVAAALGLFAFIFFFERHLGGKLPGSGDPGRLLAGFRLSAVDGLQVRHGTQFVHLERVDDGWRLTSPLRYPAQPVLVDSLLKALAALNRLEKIASANFKEFGLAEPDIVILVQQGNVRSELHIGNKTTDGLQVYIRLVGVDGIFVADASLVEKIPVAVEEWRSRALLCSPSSFTFDRFEVRSSQRGLGYALQYHSTNKTWRLSRPLQARADRPKVEQMLLKILSGRIGRFVSDNANADLELFGLQTPELELALGVGTNDLLTVQFGKSPTNDPTQVYARQVAQSNVVLVPKNLADTLRVTFNDLRERRLLAFPQEAASQIEVRGPESFVLFRDTNASWRITEPQGYQADAILTRELLSDLLTVEAAEFEKDIVTDYSPYGLATPLRQFLIKASSTNGGVLTNVLLAQIDFGTNGAGQVFARRSDENSVYLLRDGDYARLPVAAWQLRDRQIWNFPVANVVRVTVSQGGRVHQLIRRGTNDWAFGPASQGIMNEALVEQAVARLGVLQAASWVGRGVENRSRFGFAEDGPVITVEIKAEDKIQALTLELGGKSQSLAPYAAVTLDGQLWIFELPWLTHQEILQHLSVPKLPATGGT